MLSERKANIGCHPSLVRAKRADLVKVGTDWDFFRNYNPQRGWKRSKKAKQYL